MPTSQSVDISVVAPAHNEEENVQSLVDEIAGVLEGLRLSFEIIVVDDGSTDGTRRVLESLMPDRDWLRVLTMTDTPPGKGNGQSAAIAAGMVAARGQLVATVDADLQMDPTDLPAMFEAMKREDADLVQGDRSANRRDTIGRRFVSWIGRTTRRLILADNIRDTGCSLRLMKREVAVRLPLEFRGMHRFMPVTARQMGYRVIEVPVKHRPRIAGIAKYGLFDRAIPGLVDCFAVRWMRRRRRPTGAREMNSAVNAPAAVEIERTPTSV